MPCTAAQLFEFLDRLGIAHETTEHPPIFTVEEGRAWEDKIPGVGCKNLFLKDGKGLLWLVVLPDHKRADLKAIAKRIGADRLSFAKPDLLREVLGLEPGSVTPFGLLNDTDKRVNVVLDRGMMACDIVHYHPLHNTASTSVRAADILKFVQALDYKPVIVECGRDEENQGE